MRRLPSLIVLFLVACGDKPGTPPPDGPGIRGSLTVHSRIWESIGDPSQAVGIHVLLGDGSRFRQPLGRDGVARFVDPAIQGPQDVTVLAVGKTNVFADTYLALDQPEVWLQPFPRQDTEYGKQATLKGRVTGRTNGSLSVLVASADKRIRGNTVSAAADGTFEIDVTGSVAAPVHLLAMEHAYPSRRFGITKDITFTSGQTLDGVEIVLEPVEVQQQPVNVNNFEAYGTEAYVTMDFYFGSGFLFRNVATGTPPLQIPAMLLTPPFDLIELRTMVVVGSEGASGLTSASATVHTEGGSTPEATMPPPLQLTSAPLGTMEAPAVAPLEGFSLSWNVDPAAQVVRAYLRHKGRDPSLSWFVTAPSSITSFTPFELPAELTPVTRFPPGLLWLVMSADNGGVGRTYAELFEQYEAPRPDGTTWDLRREGYVKLVE